MTEPIRNATYLRKLMANREVRVRFEVDGVDFSVRITTAEAEWLRRQAQSAGRELRAATGGSPVFGAPQFLHLSVSPRGPAHS